MGKLTSELRAALGKTDCGCGCNGSGDCEKLTIQEWMDALLDERTKFLHSKDGSPEDEGSMAKAQLGHVIELASDLDKILVDADQLPAWVQDYITRAESALEAVMSYLGPKSKKP